MSDITLSKAVRSNLLNLQSTAGLLSKSQERLSTGLRVNSALDNPTNFFTAQGLSSRANDLSQLLDSVSNAVQTVAAADKGITAITKLVESAQATARQALQTAATVSTVTGADAGKVAAGAFTTLDVSGAGSAATSAVRAGTGFAAINLNSAGSSPQAATISGGGNYTPVDVSGGTKTFTIDVGSGAQTVTLDSAGSGGDDAYSVSELQTAVDTALGSGVVTVGGGVSAPLTFTTAATGTGASVTVAGTDVTDLGFTSGQTDTGAAAVTADSLSFSLTVGSTTQSITLNNSITASNKAAVTANEISAAINTQFGSNVSSVVSGQLSFTDAATGAGSTVTIGAISQAGNALSASLGITAGTSNGSATVAADSVSFALSRDGGSATAITIDAASVGAYNTATGGTLNAASLSAANVASIINQQAGATVASVGTGGGLEFTSSTTGVTSSVAITGFASAGTVGGSTGVANASDTGAATSTTSGANPKRAELVTTYNDLLGQIDALAKDSGFNGVNLLNGDNLSVLFNEDGSSKLDITGVSNSATGLGLASLASSGFDTNTSINSTLDDLKASIDTLRGQSAKFGSNLSVVETRQDFTKNMINVLQTGAANLTLADTNEEAANVLALQTRQQLSSTALSLASQADQNVLRLF